MKRFPFFFVVTALMAVAVSAPAQARGDLRGERNVRGGIVSSRQHVSTHRAGSQNVSQRSVATRKAVSHRGGGRGQAQRAGRGVARGVERGVRGHVGNVRGHVGNVRGHHAPVHRIPARRHGHWQTVCEPVLVRAGYWHRQYVPAVYGWLYDSCGHRYWGVVESACHKRVWIAPRYEDRHSRVWVGY